MGVPEGPLREAADVPRRRGDAHAGAVGELAIVSPGRRQFHERRDAIARAKKERASERRRAERSPPPFVPPWPDTTGASDEDAARVIGESVYWADYHEANAD